MWIKILAIRAPPSACRKSLFAPRGAGIHRRPSRFPCALRPEIGGATGRKNLFFPLPLLSELVKVLIIFDFNGAGNPSWVSRAHLSFPLRKSLLAAHRPFPLLGFPAHTLYPQGVCSIRKAAEPLTAALPYRRGEFTTLSTVSGASLSARPLAYAIFRYFFSCFSNSSGRPQVSSTNSPVRGWINFSPTA